LKASRNLKPFGTPSHHNRVPQKTESQTNLVPQHKTYQGDTKVRQERQLHAHLQEEDDFNFGFQIANLGARHACRVRVRATDKTQAASFIRDNWSTIEALARQNLANSPARSKLIKLQAG